MWGQTPVSRGSFSIRLSAVDVVWAGITPYLALSLRGAQVLSDPDWVTAGSFCLISFALSLLAFLLFRIRQGMSQLFSVPDAVDVVKAVVIAELTTCLVLFSTTRLDGIPRTTPVIHALLLGVGLLSARTAVRMLRSERVPLPAAEQKLGAEHIIVIGSNRLSSLYIGFLRAYAPDQHQVVASLDDRPEMIGRTLGGVRVLGPVSHLLPILTELQEHGVRVHRVLVGGDPEFLSKEASAEVRRICIDLAIKLDFIPSLIGLHALAPPSEATLMTVPGQQVPSSAFEPSRYFHMKRAIDFTAALVSIVVLVPVVLAVAALVLIDVGSPVFFWQRRLGRYGRSFLIYKFRTLKPSYDWKGRPLPDASRMSGLGRFLRRLRADELPQLLNVLVGDMSIVGPRPLLPRDQPANPAVRLSVRPGITGWAQVHGGTLLTADEKNELDEWYVRHASFRLDLLILLRTLRFLLTGERKVLHRGKTWVGTAPMTNATAGGPPIESAADGQCRASFS